MLDPRYEEFLRRLPSQDFLFGGDRPEGFLGGRRLVAGAGVVLNETVDTVEVATTTSEAFPVGSVFIAVVATNPGTLLGYGTWVAFAAGRVLVGLDSGDTDFDAIEETGGSKTHTLTLSEIPSHVHGQQAPTSDSGGTVELQRDTGANSLNPNNANIDTLPAGGGGAHNNVQPYIVVHMWKRTA